MTNLEALKIKPASIKGWLEGVQDEEDLENPIIDKIRNVMRLVYVSAQANDLIPIDAISPVNHVHISTTTAGSAGKNGCGDGLDRRHDSPDSVAVGERPWVISLLSDHQCLQGHALKPAWILDGMMVARDGVEPPTPAFSGLRSTT
jgi:hypothetical protein